MLLDEERGNDIVPRVGLMRQDVRELNQIADVLGWELTEERRKLRSDGSSGSESGRSRRKQRTERIASAEYAVFYEAAIGRKETNSQ